MGRVLREWDVREKEEETMLFSPPPLQLLS